jgi:hypothetical protein
VILGSSVYVAHREAVQRRAGGAVLAAPPAPTGG